MKTDAQGNHTFKQHPIQGRADRDTAVAIVTEKRGPGRSVAVGLLSLAAFIAVAFASLLEAQVARHNPRAQREGPGDLRAVESPPAFATFWSWQKTNLPPLPFNPLPGLPVYWMGDEWYLVDDLDVDYGALTEQRQLDRALRTLEAQAGLTATAGESVSVPLGWAESGSEESEPPTILMTYDYPAGSFFLEILSVSNNANLVLHGTTSEKVYSLLSQPELTNGSWQVESVFRGTIGRDWTDLAVPVGSRTNSLFFRAMVGPTNDQPGSGISVAVTNPVSEAFFDTWPTNILIQAAASSTNGSILGVAFYADSALLGFDGAAPYELTWSNVLRGVYTLTARAFDSTGASLTSTGIPIRVDPCYPAVDAVLVIDRSGSMAGQKFDDARLACSNFVSHLYFAADQVGLIAFDTYPTNYQTLTSDSNAVLLAIHDVPPPGLYTHMSNAIHMAREELTSTRHNTNALPVMVLLSDGWPEDSDASILAEASLAKTSDHIRIFTIGLGDVKESLMQGIASSTNDYFYTTNSSDLSGLFTAVAAKLCRANPTVQLTWPTNASTFDYGTWITLQAIASDSDGAISSVRFYRNATNCIGLGTQVTGNLWSFTWSGAPMGTNVVTAIATDDSGLSTTSAGITLSIVHPPPSVLITSPSAGQIFPFSPTNVLIQAAASASGSVITNVAFFCNANSIGRDFSPPYQLLWTNVVAASNYSLTVVAEDGLGAKATNAVSVGVNWMPSVTIAFPTSSPTCLFSFVEHTNLTLWASAFDHDGSITNLQFLCSTGQIAGAVSSSNGADFCLTWTNLSTGRYPITARATDNRGASSSSQVVVFAVATTNPAPAVFISHPASNAIFNAGATITISAVASNHPAGGAVTNVEFFVDAAALGSDPSAPYSATECCWRPGRYTLRARAMDDLGGDGLSDPVFITVSNSVPTRGKGFWNPEPHFPAFMSYYGTSAIKVDGSDVYIGFNGDGIPPLVKWDGTNWAGWHADEGYPLLRTFSIEILDSVVYVCGQLLQGPAWAVARWNGTQWETVGEVLNASACGTAREEARAVTMAVVGADLYVAGLFSSAGENTNVQYLARLNRASNTWESVGPNLNAPVYAIAAVEGKLFVGGVFTNAGGNPDANYVARLDGNTWTNLATGVGGTNDLGEDGAVFALAACGTNLYVGGDFTSAGGNTNANGIAIWNGKSWGVLNRGLVGGLNPWEGGLPNLIVYSISPRGDSVYVAGNFDAAWGEGTNQLAAVNVARANWSEDLQAWSWADLDMGVGFWYDEDNTPVGDGFGVVTAILDDPVPGVYDLFVGGWMVNFGTLPVSSKNAARWSVGRPAPPTAPKVTITLPANCALITTSAPVTLTIAATATSNYTNINTVEFSVDEGPGSEGWSPSNGVYTIDWPGLTAGVHLLRAVATDDAGLKAGSEPVLVTIRDPTNSVAAGNDFYSIPEGSPAVAFNVLTNDTSSNGVLRVSRVLQAHRNFGIASVGYNGGYLDYVPFAGVHGTDSFAYTVTNASGASDSAWVTVHVRSRPVVWIEVPVDGARYGASSNVNLSAQGLDWDGSVTNLVLCLNGSCVVSQAPTNALSASWSTNAPAFYTFTAIATDNEGLSNCASPVTIAITNGATATNLLTASIDNLAPAIAGQSELWVTNYPVVREGLFHLLGKARDSNPSDPVTYQLLVCRPEDNPDPDVPPAPFANITPPPLDGAGFHIGGDLTNSLGILDLTALPNGTYDLVLTVHGGGGEAGATARFHLDTELKIGQFGFSEQDLVIPVNGIPLTVTRTYNSLNPRSADFGYGWTYDLIGMDVQLDEQRQEVTVGQGGAWFADDAEDDNGLPKVVSLRTGGGWDVSLTLPDGRRTTFAFTPDMAPSTCHAYAKWTPPDDVHATLAAIDSAESEINCIPFLPPYWQMGGDNSTLENHDIRGWRLTTQDGTQYEITRGPANNLVCDLDGTGKLINIRAYGTPRLTRIVQRTGDEIHVDADGIFHYANGTNLTRQVLFERDARNRITAIRDPNSGSNGLPVLKYIYHRDTGNLLQVWKLVDRAAGTYLTNRYHYDNAAFPHYITEIDKAKGVPTIRTLYDDSGRLIGMIDVAGRTNSFVHNIANRQETIYDRSGQPTIYTYDTQGNVIGTMDALGHTNGFAYDASGNLTNSVDPLGNVTSYVNDTSGNVLSVTVPYPAGANPANYTTWFTWDQYGNQTSTRGPSGDVITNIFDPNTGNLMAITDEAENVISSITYNSAGLPATETDHFGVLSYGYDLAGNLTYMTNSLDNVVQSSYDLNGNLTNMVNNGSTTSVGYDAMNRQTSVDCGEGITAIYAYPSEGDWSTLDGSTLGHMERRTDEQGRLSGWTTANASTPGFAYDVSGRLEYETNSIGVVTRTVYNAVGWVVATTNLATGAWTAYRCDDAGRRIAVTNALGQVTRFDYWPSGSLKAITNALGTNYWLYSDAAGACSACGNSGSITDTLGRVTESVTSLHGLPLQTIRRASAGATGLNAATNGITYLSGMTTPEQEGQDYPASITDEGGRTRQYDYTPLGQLYRATDLSGSSWWTNQYDLNTGNVTNLLSPTAETLSYFYDGLNNVQAIRFGDGNWMTNFYNAQNRLSGVRLPSGVALTNFYDFAGRLTNHSSTIGETVSYAYNANNAVTTMTDNTGGTTNLYDAGGRLWGIDYPSGASVRYQLDLLNRITAITNKASSGGTAYVTQYRYNAVGNITNVIDPFNGNTSFEYDRVGRRTKRTLPNGIVTEWQYNWRDHVTNIMHKTSGGTILAGVLYERATGGEPTKITREDGTYVELKYDASFRLTNEVHCSSSGTPQTTNSYCYDASGSRVRLVKGSTILTNSVLAGYRITVVKDAANGNTVESYAYDNSGRVMTITRDGGTLNLGYNSMDQVTAVTNGASWVTYRHDANGRRTVSTNSAGTVRRLLVAPTPGSDLESPHLIANVGGTVQQGYVYFGDEPLLRYSSSGTAGYYLEDGMGSVIGIAPATTPGTGNTTRLFYDGFGNKRATNGPAPTVPTGAGGDFHFHGAWLEEGSDIYNMRLREYDPRLGRFTSRDPRNGLFQRAETLHPYVYAVNNPHVFTDPSGEFTLIEINVSSMISYSMQSLRGYVVNRTKKYLKERIFEAVSTFAIEQLGDLYPTLGSVWNALHNNEVAQAGRNFEAVFQNMVCGAVGVDGPLTSILWFYPEITANGDATRNGLNCPNISAPGLGANNFYPDFILSEVAPKEASKQSATGQSIFIGDFKLSGNSLYKQYVRPGTHRPQFDAITRYAGQHTYTRTAVFLTVFSGHKSNLRQVQALLGGDALKEGVVAIVIAKYKNRKFND